MFAANNLLFRQLFEPVSCTFTYIVGCAVTREAAIIDPVLETVQRDIKLIRELNLNLRYGFNTHVHADHVTGTGMLAKELSEMKSVLGANSRGKADVHVTHRQIIRLGNKEIEVRFTPGHTNGCVTYVIHSDRIAFTGDALLFRGCGRTDFQEGDAGLLYDSVWNEILSLPDDYALMIGHNYEGHQMTTVAEEKKYNARLTHPKEEFVRIMNNLNLPHPKQIHIAVPANLKNGEV